MRTTLDLPDELFRQVKTKAAMEGVSLRSLLTGYVAKGLQHSPPGGTERRKRITLPVIRRRGRGVIPNVTPELQGKLEQEEDLAKLRRSF